MGSSYDGHYFVKNPDLTITAHWPDPRPETMVVSPVAVQRLIDAYNAMVADAAKGWEWAERLADAWANSGTCETDEQCPVCNLLAAFEHDRLDHIYRKRGEQP